MLNLLVMVRNYFFLFLGLVMPIWSVFFQFSRPKIDSPQAGEALQGAVTITGTTDVVGFSSMEVSFSYGTGSDGTWFLIAQSDQPVRDGILATWDTSSIADGIYQLRVWVDTVDGETVEMVVKDLRVRNYTPVETNTPPPEKYTAEPQAVAPVSTAIPTPTLLPPNPASVTMTRLGFSIVQGMVFVLVAFMIIGIYGASRRKRPRR
jgi:hypothetical protein